MRRESLHEFYEHGQKLNDDDARTHACSFCELTKSLLFNTVEVKKVYIPWQLLQWS